MGSVKDDIEVRPCLLVGVSNSPLAPFYGALRPRVTPCPIDRTIGKGERIRESRGVEIL